MNIHSFSSPPLPPPFPPLDPSEPVSSKPTFSARFGSWCERRTEGTVVFLSSPPLLLNLKGWQSCSVIEEIRKNVKLCRHICLTAKTSKERFTVLLCFQVSAALLQAILCHIIRGKGNWGRGLNSSPPSSPPSQKLPPTWLKFGMCPGMTNMLFLACKLEDRSLNNNQVHITLCNLKSKFLSFYDCFYFDWNKNCNFDTQGSIVM